MKKAGLFILGLILAASPAALADALDHWTKVATTPYGSYAQIIYANGAFMAISDLPLTNIYTPSINGGFSVSTDGLNWQHFASGTQSPTGITSGIGTNVAVSENAFDFGDDGAFFYSAGSAAPTNEVYTNTANAVVSGQYAVSFGYSVYTTGPFMHSNGLFVALGYNYGNVAGTVATSANGINWAAGTITASNVFLDGVAYGNNTYLAVGAYPYSAGGGFSEVYRSVDGTNWISLSTNTYRNLTGLAGLSFLNGTFYGTPLASGGYPSNVFTTTTGSTWILKTIPYPSLYVPGTYKSNFYVSVHPGYPLATSPDNVNWTTRTNSLTNIFTGIAYGSNYFMLCTADGSLYRSDSTIPTLTSIGYAASGGFQFSLSGGLGPTYQIQVSPDLVNWSNIFTVTNIELNNQFVDTSATNAATRFYRTLSQ